MLVLFGRRNRVLAVFRPLVGHRYVRNTVITENTVIVLLPRYQKFKYHRRQPQYINILLYIYADGTRRASRAATAASLSCTTRYARVSLLRKRCHERRRETVWTAERVQRVSAPRHRRCSCARAVRIRTSSSFPPPHPRPMLMRSNHSTSDFAKTSYFVAPAKI